MTKIRPRADHIPLTDAEATAALGKFRDDLPGYLAEDPSAKLSSGPMVKDPSAIFVVVVTSLDADKTDAAVHKCAAHHDLNAVRLPDF